MLQSELMNPSARAVLTIGLWLAAPCAFAQGYSVVTNPSQGGGTTTVVTQTTGAPGPVTTNNPNGAIAVMPTATQGGGIRTSDEARGIIRGRRPEEYAGLSPGSPRMSPGLSRMLGVRRTMRDPVVAWPGFQMVPGGSRLFLATTRPVTVTESTPRPMVRVLHIDHAQILRSNSRRPLETVAFATPLVQAVLRPVRGGLDLIMTMRADVAPRTTQEPAANGLSMVFVDFPSYALPEVARIRDAAGNTIVVGTNTAPASNAPPTSAAPPSQATPVRPQEMDTERPPGIR